MSPAGANTAVTLPHPPLNLSEMRITRLSSLPSMMDLAHETHPLSQYIAPMLAMADGSEFSLRNKDTTAYPRMIQILALIKRGYDGFIMWRPPYNGGDDHREHVAAHLLYQRHPDKGTQEAFSFYTMHRLQGLGIQTLLTTQFIQTAHRTRHIHAVRLGAGTKESIRHLWLKFGQGGVDLGLPMNIRQPLDDPENMGWIDFPDKLKVA